MTRRWLDTNAAAAYLGMTLVRTAVWRGLVKPSGRRGTRPLYLPDLLHLGACAMKELKPRDVKEWLRTIEAGRGREAARSGAR